MTRHSMPHPFATEELIVGWTCTACGEWIPVVDPTWSDCPGPPGAAGGLDSDSTLTGEAGR